MDYIKHKIHVFALNMNVICVLNFKRNEKTIEFVVHNYVFSKTPSKRNCDIFQNLQRFKMRPLNKVELSFPLIIIQFIFNRYYICVCVCVCVIICSKMYIFNSFILHSKHRGVLDFRLLI